MTTAHKTRRSWQTGEFWATFALAVGTITASAVGGLPPKWAAIANSISVAALAISRGLSKI